MNTFDETLVVKTDRRFLNRDRATPTLLELVNVDESLTDYIRILDTQGDLVLLHYLTMNTKQGTVDTDLLAKVGHVRGTIIDSRTKEIVCRSFPYTPEVSSSEDYTVPEGSRVFQACEGTILRYYFHDGEWRLSTHRKISAHQSYWSGPTFGKMFDELATFDKESLNKEYCYILLMSHPENKLIFEITEAKLAQLAVYDRSNTTFLPVGEGVIDGLSVPKSLDITSREQVVDVCKEFTDEETFDKVGVIIIPDESDPHPIKIITENYDHLRDVRGNDPSLRTRYLQLRNTSDRETLIKNFDSGRLFSDVEQEIESLSRKLHRWYMDLFVHHNREERPKEEYVTLQRCHQWHKEDRRSNIVTLTKVREILAETPSHFLLIMVNRHRDTQKEIDYPEDFF